MYVLADGLALTGFILGFTHWALDVPPKLTRTQSRVKRGGTETRHGASLHTWRGGGCGWEMVIAPLSISVTESVFQQHRGG